MKVLLTATVQSHICQFHKPLAEVLHEKGYEVHVTARNNLAEKNGLKLDFVEKVYDIPFSRSPKSIDNIKAFKQLKNIIDTNNYDLIICNTPVGGVLTRLASKKTRKNGTKVIYIAHGFHFYKGAPRKNWLIFYPIEKYMSKYCDTLITINEEDYKLAKEKFKKTNVEHIHGVGVDEKRYHPVDDKTKCELRKKLNLKEDDFVILCTGELLPNKNQQMAIKAIKKVVKEKPNTLLLIAGNGPEKENLERLIKELDLNNNVKLLGYTTNLQDYQMIADACVSCSKREGLPLNIVEAMLTKTPVIATNNRGNRELVINEETGHLVDVDDISNMSKCLLNINNNYIENAYSKALNYGFSNVKKELIYIC